MRIRKKTLRCIKQVGREKLSDMPGEENAIDGLVLKVSDLERAKTFLREKGMLDSTMNGQARIDPTKIYGLNIRLT